LKFGDIIIAVASFTVLFLLVYFALGILLIGANSYWGLDAAGIVSLFIAALAVGYAFAGKIREESRIMSIGKVAVLSAVVMMFAVIMSVGAVWHYSTLIDETLQKMFSTGSWTTTDWYAYETLALVEQTALNVVYTLVFSFIGLYVGSMRKPPAKTKE
jgi:hypothetical protein